MIDNTDNIPDFVPPTPEQYGISSKELEFLRKKREEASLLGKSLLNDKEITASGILLPVVLIMSAGLCILAFVKDIWEIFILLPWIGLIFVYFLEFADKRLRMKKLNKISDEYDSKIQALYAYEQNLNLAKNNYSFLIQQIQQRKINFWFSLDGITFEKELEKLFTRAGFQVERTPASGDHGIDLNIYKDQTRIIVQCKAHKNPIGPKEVRELYGTLMANEDASLAYLITTHGATKGAYGFAKGKPLEIWDVRHITKLADSLK